MIEKHHIEKIVEDWLVGRDYFLTDCRVSPDNSVVIEIDSKDGVWIEDCAALSRYVEEHLNRDDEDFELEVGSAGLGQPFKVKQQYTIHIGDEVEILTSEGAKVQGVLTEATEEKITCVAREKVREPGSKRPKLIDVAHTIAYTDIKTTKLIIHF